MVNRLILLNGYLSFQIKNKIKLSWIMLSYGESKKLIGVALFNTANKK